MDKLLIVEDASIIVEGLTHILEKSSLKNMEIYHVDSLEKMENMLETGFYKVAIIGVSVEGKPTNSILRLIVKFASTNMIVFSNNTNALPYRNLYQAGLKGILSKSDSEKEILFAITQAYLGETYVGQKILERLLLSTSESKISFDKLSEREKEIADLLTQGKKNQQIGVLLGLRPSTVSTFKIRIFKKLQVKNVIDLKNAKQDFGSGN